MGRELEGSANLSGGRGLGGERELIGAGGRGRKRADLGEGKSEERARSWGLGGPWHEGVMRISYCVLRERKDGQVGKE